MRDYGTAQAGDCVPLSINVASRPAPICRRPRRRLNSSGSPKHVASNGTAQAIRGGEGSASNAVRCCSGKVTGTTTSQLLPAPSTGSSASLWVERRRHCGTHAAFGTTEKPADPRHAVGTTAVLAVGIDRDVEHNAGKLSACLLERSCLSRLALKPLALKPAQWPPEPPLSSRDVGIKRATGKSAAQRRPFGLG
jgi:hypothetical protein